MNCAEIQELLSAAADGAADDPIRVVEARMHCTTCSACARFREVIATSGSAASPAAPPELVDSLVALARDEAAHLRAERTAAAVPLPAADKAPNRRVAWLPRLTAYVAAAAVVVVSVTVLSISISRLGSQKGAEDTALAPEAALSSSPAPATPDNDASGDGRAAAEVATDAAPSYITLDGRVFLLAGPATVAPSALTTAGVVTSAFDTMRSPETLVAWYVRADRTRILVERRAGSLTSFEAVVRSFGGTPYQLMSGDAIGAYGTWPTLPSRFAAPTEADDAPTFRYFGTDDLGASIYVPVGGRIEDGFAVAPATTPDSPAAGNPNWTWWQALP